MMCSTAAPLVKELIASLISLYMSSSWWLNPDHNRRRLVHEDVTKLGFDDVGSVWATVKVAGGKFLWNLQGRQ